MERVQEAALLEVKGGAPFNGEVNITIPLPAVSLLQLCLPPDQPPQAVATAPHLLRKQSGDATVVFWVPIPAAAGGDAVRTYEVQCSTSGPQGGFVRVNTASDLIGTGWIHRYSSSTTTTTSSSSSTNTSTLRQHNSSASGAGEVIGMDPQQGTRRCYRVRAVDYWGRAGAVSPVACDDQ
jgi:hypothetical protein